MADAPKKSDDKRDQIAADCIKRYEAARADRGVWELHWEEIARRILPGYVNTFIGPESIRNGQRHTEHMIDATGALALPKFAAAMESMLTPRNSTWHSLQPLDKALLRNRTARVWFDDVTQALFRYRYMPFANYAANQHEVYMGLGAFGTGAMYVDALDRRYGGGIRYASISVGEVYFLTNHQGIVDTAIRRFQLTARQAVQRFSRPGDDLPEEIRKAADETSKADSKYWFVNLVQPRGDADGYDPDRLDVKGTQFVSYSVSETGKRLVREGGFHTFPYSISRYVVAPGETYGRSPAMLVLPSLKTLNEQKRTVLKQGHRSVDPVLLAHDDGVMNDVTLSPGAVNWGGVTADGKPLVHALPTGNLALAKEMLEEERSIINDGFLVTLFQILIDTPQMTATEVLERAREKGALLSPTMGRQQSEFFGPMIEREIDVLAAQGMIPQMPPIVKQARAEYHVQYDSPLSRMQRAERATGFLQLVNWVRDTVAVTQDPSPLDWIDMDVAMPEMADISAMPPSWIRSADGVAAIRKQRQQAQMVDKAAQAAPGAAAVMKALPSVRLTGQAAPG